MATATITISDVEDTGQLNIKIELDPPVEKGEEVNDARSIASMFLQWLQEKLAD